MLNRPNKLEPATSHEKIEGTAQRDCSEFNYPQLHVKVGFTTTACNTGCGALRHYTIGITCHNHTERKSRYFRSPAAIYKTDKIAKEKSSCCGLLLSKKLDKVQGLLMNTLPLSLANSGARGVNRQHHGWQFLIDLSAFRHFLPFPGTIMDNTAILRSALHKLPHQGAVSKALR